MRKLIRYIIVVLTVLISLYTLLIVIESIRFNNEVGVHPIIKIDEEKKVLGFESGIVDKTYTGIGYTFTYEYNVVREENSDVVNIQVISGKFKLFGKVLLFA